MMAVKEKGIIKLVVNEEKREVTVRAADTLLHVLREKLGLTEQKRAVKMVTGGPVLF